MTCLGSIIQTYYVSKIMRKYEDANVRLIETLIIKHTNFRFVIDFLLLNVVSNWFRLIYIHASYNYVKHYKIGFKTKTKM